MTKKKPQRELRYRICFMATANDIRQMRKKLLDLAPDLKARINKIESGPSRADRLADAMSDVQDALGEVESLHEEIEAWKEGLPENLQNGSKADELDECLSQLDGLRSNLDDAVTEGTQVSFPGMY